MQKGPNGCTITIEDRESQKRLERKDERETKRSEKEGEDVVQKKIKETRKRKIVRG
jgi:hypothetical protein